VRWQNVSNIDIIGLLNKEGEQVMKQGLEPTPKGPSGVSKQNPV
jgi:hypothetical protein